MQNQMFDTFNSSTIKRFSPASEGQKERAKFPTAYHYTSAEACLQILQNQNIRFSDIQYMNDKTETVYGIKVALDVLEKNKGKFPYCEEAIYDLLKRNDLSSIRNLCIHKIDYNEPSNDWTRRQFVFCLSTASDSLNMWNYYVRNGAYQGYSIGFKIREFLKTFDTPKSDVMDSFFIYYGKVVYKEKEQIEEIERYLSETEKKLQAEIWREKSQYWKEWIKNEIKEKLKLYGLFFKYKSFESEKEFRIVLDIYDTHIPRTETAANKYFGTNNKHISEAFYTRGGMIVPCLQIKVPHACITKITISPTIEFDIARNSLAELLLSKGLSDVEICQSTVPIRD